MTKRGATTLMNSFLVFFYISCSPFITSRVAFLLLRGLLGPFWRALRYIPMFFLLLNEFRTVNELQGSLKNALRCVSCHWKTSEFLLALPSWSILCFFSLPCLSYTDWIDVFACHINDSITRTCSSVLLCVYLAGIILSVEVFSWGSCLNSKYHRTSMAIAGTVWIWHENPARI